MPFADKLDTNATLVTDCAFAAIVLNTFVKLVNEVTLTVAKALLSSVKLTAATFANALARAPKFVGEMFANLFERIDKLVVVILLISNGT